MAAGYIPRPDTDFAAWMDNFVTYANAHLADLGLLPADGLALTNGNNDWKAKLAAHVAAAAAAQSARQAKDDARASLEGLVRPMVRTLQGSPAVDDSERAALGITVRDTTLTPTGPPTTTPVLRLESPARLRHIIHFTDAATPTSRAKPAGVMGAEIWISLQPVGAPTPTDPALFTLVALDTRTPYTLDFPAADGGKNAHYLARWVGTKGDKGPWSETATATVGV
jgi:hypothetical protein